MIVDDSEPFLAVARDHLTRGGLDVVGTATCQRDALEMAEELRPDVVLVDVRLGTESGLELTRLLVDDRPDLRTHVVLISTLDQDDVADLVAVSSAAGFLPKYLLSARAVVELLEISGRRRCSGR